MAGPNGGNGDLGFAAELFKAADKLRQNVEPSEYKHIVLGFIFLKYLSDEYCLSSFAANAGKGGGECPYCGCWS